MLHWKQQSYFLPKEKEINAIFGHFVYEIASVNLNRGMTEEIWQCQLPATTGNII